MNQEPGTIQLIEETAHIEKRAVMSGKVTVRTPVDTQVHLVDANLAVQTVSVERVPIDREVGAAPQIRTEGNVTIIPVVEERLVVEKRLVLVEEIRLTTIRTVEKVEVPVELRKQRAVIDRTDG